MVAVELWGRGLCLRERKMGEKTILAVFVELGTSA